VNHQDGALSSAVVSQWLASVILTWDKDSDAASHDCGEYMYWTKKMSTQECTGCLGKGDNEWYQLTWVPMIYRERESAYHHKYTYYSRNRQNVHVTHHLLQPRITEHRLQFIHHLPNPVPNKQPLLPALAENSRDVPPIIPGHQHQHHRPSHPQPQK
jgi:hypothetical protein